MRSQKSSRLSLSAFEGREAPATLLSFKVANLVSASLNSTTQPVDSTGNPLPISTGGGQVGNPPPPPPPGPLPT